MGISVVTLESVENRRFLSATFVNTLLDDQTVPSAVVVLEEVEPGDDSNAGGNGADDPAGDDHGGDSRSDSHDCGTIHRIKKFDDAVGTDDKVDVYKFKISSKQTFSASLIGLKANADLSLLDSKGHTLKKSHHSGTGGESISRSLTAGTYYAQVTSVTGTTTYNLRLSPTK